MGGLGPGEAKEWGALGHEAARLLEEMPKPTIAAINGFALGGGCELALGCDLRYASSNARLGQPEIDLGIVPGWGGTQRLARVCGLGVAKELVLTGRPVDAEEALRIGLVNGIADPVLDHALEVAGKLAAKSPVRAPRREAAAQPLARRARAGGGGVRRPVRERGRQGGPRRIRREAAAPLRRQVIRRTAQEDSRRTARSSGPHALALSSRRSGCRRRDGRYARHARLRRAEPADGGTAGGAARRGPLSRADRRDLGAGDGRRDPRLPAGAGAPRHGPRGRAHAGRDGTARRPAFRCAHAPPRRVRLGRGGTPVPARPPGDQRSRQCVLRPADAARRAAHASAPPPAQRRRRRAAHVLGSRQAAAGAARPPHLRRLTPQVPSPPPAHADRDPCRPCGRVALVDRAPLPHHGREARTAESPRPEPLPPDRDAPPRAARCGTSGRPTTAPGRVPHPERRLGPRASRPLGGALRGQRPPRRGRSRGWSPATTTRSSRRSERAGSCSFCRRPSASPSTS